MYFTLVVLKFKEASLTN